MTRRSIPQSKIDERAFPVRLHIHVPDGGLGSTLERMDEWLHRECGRGNFAHHGAGQLANNRDAIAIYLCDPRAVGRFVDAFPMLQIADGTKAPGYSSLAFPFGLDN